MSPYLVFKATLRLHPHDPCNLKQQHQHKLIPSHSLGGQVTFSFLLGPTVPGTTFCTKQQSNVYHTVCLSCLTMFITPDDVYHA